MASETCLTLLQNMATRCRRGKCEKQKNDLKSISGCGGCEGAFEVIRSQWLVIIIVSLPQSNSLNVLDILDTSPKKCNVPLP